MEGIWRWDHNSSWDCKGMSNNINISRDNNGSVLPVSNILEHISPPLCAAVWGTKWKIMYWAPPKSKPHGNLLFIMEIAIWRITKSLGCQGLFKLIYLEENCPLSTLISCDFFKWGISISNSKDSWCKMLKVFPTFVLKMHSGFFVPQA